MDLHAFMASRAKYTKASKAMKELGYTSQIVRPVLKNLLQVYEQNWSLIEDEDYAVLVDAILTSEEGKVWPLFLLLGYLL